MRVLITGTSGFIGGALSRALIAQGHEVWGWSRTHDPRSGVAPEHHITRDLSLGAGDVMPGSLDLLVHCAAIAAPRVALTDPTEAFRVNAVGTAAVYAAARSVGAPVVLVSSVYIYDGTPDLPWTEDARLSPRSPLGASKLAAEAVARSYWECFAVPTVVVRPFTVYGPGSSEEQFIPSAIRTIVTAERRAEFGAPDATRDFVYVDDVVTALIACGDRVRSVGGFDVFNVAGGVERTIGDVVRAIARIARRDDVQLVFGRGPARADERSGASRHWASIEKVRSELGWAPAVSFEEGLRRTYDAVVDGSGS